MYQDNVKDRIIESIRQMDDEQLDRNILTMESLKDYAKQTNHGWDATPLLNLYTDEKNRRTNGGK